MRARAPQLPSSIRAKAEWFSYPLLFEGAAGTGLVSLASQTLSIQIQSGQQFLWTHAYAEVTCQTAAGDGVPYAAYQGAATPAASLLSWPLRVTIQDSGTQSQMMNAEVPLASVFGSQVNGWHELPSPRLFKPNSSIQVTLRRFAQGQLDNAGANTATVLRAHLLFEGWRILSEQALNLTR